MTWFLLVVQLLLLLVRSSWQAKPTDKVTGKCKQCYGQLCNSTDSFDSWDVVKGMFPGYFSTAEELGFNQEDGCYLDCSITRKRNDDAGYCLWKCPRQFSFTGCNPSDGGKACITCLHFAAPLSNYTVNGLTMYPVQLASSGYAAYQTFPIGLCGSPGICPGICAETGRNIDILVSRQPILYPHDFLDTDYWWQSMEFPNHCTCL